MFTVTLKEIISEFQLEVVSCEDKIEEKVVSTPELGRPGLQLAGFYEHIGEDRIQIIGNAESSYIEQMEPDERLMRLEEFFKFGFPCVIIARGLEVCSEIHAVSKKYGIPVLRTKEVTSRFFSYLINYLNVQLAPRENKHGVLVEVYGEGILILGDSSVGKSETALELVKRGHRLVADDVVEVRKVSDRTLVGTAPDIIRHFMEIRAIGILDVKTLFGVGSVKMTEKINLVIHLEKWDKNKLYDRLGLVEEYTDILGVKIPLLSIPVRPGRNLAMIVEVAAMNNRQRVMGYNAAKVLNDRIMAEISKKTTENR